ncbi:MAG: hypothetical protein IJH13_04215 [Bacilli bacterium]|nr:hypothetical protein [Bacilli bacterium]
MLDETYEYLHEYGFDALELDSFERLNHGVFYLDYNDVRKIITFLEDKFLFPDEIIKIININPFLLTESSKKINELENIYNELGFDHNQLRTLITKNPLMYSVNPDEVEKIVEYLRMQSLDNEKICKLIIKNPKIINMKFEEFKTEIY